MILQKCIILSDIREGTCFNFEFMIFVLFPISNNSGLKDTFILLYNTRLSRKAVLYTEYTILYNNKG